MTSITYADLYQYQNLAAAYVAVSNGRTPDDCEERATNLLNHMVWHTYKPGDDRTNDAIVKAALRRLFQSRGLDIQDVTDPQLLRLIGAILEEEGGSSWQTWQDLITSRTLD